MKSFHKFAAVTLTAMLLVLAALVAVPQTALATGGVQQVRVEKSVARGRFLDRFRRDAVRVEKVVVREQVRAPLYVAPAQFVAPARYYVPQAFVAPQAFYAPQQLNSGCNHAAPGQLQFNAGGCQALYGR